MSEKAEQAGVGHAEFFAMLAAPFEPGEVKARTQGGRTLYYATARTVMNRLDDVCGPGCWWDEYAPGKDSVLCKLSVMTPDGRVLTKQEAGAYAGMQDPGDDDKSGYSDALKRAAFKFGVGRYLYGDGAPRFVCEFLGIRPEDFTVEGIARMKGAPLPRDNSGQRPSAPPPPREQNGSPTQQPPTRQNGSGSGSGGGRQAGGRFGDDLGNMPRDGRGMFAWSKKRQEAGFANALRDVSAIGQNLGLPDRMVEWNGDDVAQVWNLVVGSANAPPQGAPVVHRGAGDEDMPF